MALTNEADVREGVLTRWAAHAILDALIPAATRVYADRVAEKTDWPAAAVRVTEGEVTRTGGADYLRRFRLEVTALCRADAADERPIRAAVSAAFGGTAADPTAGLSVPGATVICCLEDAGGARAEPERIDGSDFVRLSSAFDVTVQGTL